MSLIQRFVSGRTKNIPNRLSKKYLEEALYYRLFKEGGEEVNVRRQLNLFLKSKKRVFKWEVDDTLIKLRDRKLYAPALKLSEIMSTRRGVNKTVSDQAIHLDLIAKTRGIAEAENYFIDLPESSKNHLTYCALLNCYCKKMNTEKAEALMEKMKELDMAITSMPYNQLMTLYSETSKLEKIPAIIQEMKTNQIMPDSYMYNVWMRALAAANDIFGVERVVDEMKRDGRVSPDWTTYSNLASIYAEAGLFDKTETALKELEKRNEKRELSAYNFLITLYGKTGNLREVYRVWRSHRLAFSKTPNISYLNLIQTLIKLNDLPGAEKHFREWHSGRPTYDMRIVNSLIQAYVNEGQLEKAEETKKGALHRGAKPNAKTYEIYLEYYLKSGEMKLAVDCIANAISLGRGDGSKWVPSDKIIMTLMGYFEQEKDVDSAENFLEIVRKSVDDLGTEVFESLIRTYAGAGRTSLAIGRRLKMENIEVSEESKKLLDVICVE
ncbi:hypothetical protein ACFE04_008778 [Oxalis oulophora]